MALGARAVASAISLPRRGRTNEQIKNHVETAFGHDLGTPLDQIREGYEFDVSCKAGSMSQAIRDFLESDDNEHAVRLPGHLHRRGLRHDRLHGRRDRPGVLRRHIRAIALRTYEVLVDRLGDVTRAFIRRFGWP